MSMNGRISEKSLTKEHVRPDSEHIQSDNFRKSTDSKHESRKVDKKNSETNPTDPTSLG